MIINNSRRFGRAAIAATGAAAMVAAGAAASTTATASAEPLDVGSGDTYIQSLPGQSFDVTGLPNGTYYIQVVANPEKRLFESSTSNNTSVRKVILGGTLHHRTVKVRPVNLVDAP